MAIIDGGAFMRTNEHGEVTEESLAIIGNGFDLNLGAQTSYESFFECLKDCFNAESLSNFKSSYISDDNEIAINNFYNLLDKNKDNYFVNYFLNYQKAIGSWVSFENELTQIICAFDELITCLNSEDGTVIDVSGFPILNIKVLDKHKLLSVLNVFPKNKFFTVNNSLFEITTNKTGGISMFFGDETKKGFHDIRYKTEIFSETFPKELYKDLVVFSDLFSIYLSIVNHFVKYNCVFNALKDCRLFVNYNYTRYLERFLLKRDQETEQIVYINGTVNTMDGKRTDNIVFGIDSSVVLKNKGFEVFTKSIQRSLMDTDIKMIESLSKEYVSAIYVFGHSLSLADYESLHFLFLSYSKKIRKIVIYCYDRNARIELTINLKAILGDDLFYQFQREGIISFPDSSETKNESENADK